MKKLLTILLISVSLSSFAQKEKTVTVTMPVSFWEVVLKWLLEGPAKETMPVFNVIKSQAGPQLKDTTKAKK